MVSSSVAENTSICCLRIQAEPLRCFPSVGRERGMVSPGPFRALVVFDFDFFGEVLITAGTPLAAFFAGFLPPDFLVEAEADGEAAGFATGDSSASLGMYVCVLAQARAAVIS